MEAANANGQSNTVYLARGTYSLLEPYSIDPPSFGVGLPPVTGNIAIVGAGPEATIIRASSPDPLTFFGLVEVEASGQLVLERLSLRDGNAAFSAGAIWNRGTAAIHDVVLAGNVAFGPGAIINEGSMSIVDSDIRGNFTDLVGGGCCAIFNGGRMEILRSVVQGNGGVQAGVGAILNVDDLTITESVVTNNLSDNIGGIANFAELKIVRSSISNNLFPGIGFVFVASELANLQGGRTIIENTTIVTTFGGVPRDSGHRVQREHALTAKHNRDGISGADRHHGFPSVVVDWRRNRRNKRSEFDHCAAGESGAGLRGHSNVARPQHHWRSHGLHGDSLAE